MLRSNSHLYDEKGKKNILRHSHSRSETSAKGYYQAKLPSPPDSDIEREPLPEGQGTVRRRPAKRSLRHPFVSATEDVDFLPGSENEGPRTPRKYTRSKTAPQPPLTPVTPKKSGAFGDTILTTPPTTPGDPVAKAEDDCPFPLQPVPIIIGGLHKSKHDTEVRQAKRRCISAGGIPLTPPTTPDRFITNRNLGHDASSNFQVSKPADQLTSTEKLLRQKSATPDPFRSPSTARQGRPRIPSSQSPRNVSGPARVISGTNLLNPTLNPLNTQNRQVSTGAVWNVGGSAATTPTGPMNGIPDGRGGLLGSGTNAPMYTSRFFESNTPDQDRGRLEGRLAAALDIDQANRVLNHSQSPNRGGGSSSVAGSSPSRSTPQAYRTEWKDGHWVRGEALSCEFLCYHCLIRVECFGIAVKTETNTAKPS